MGNDPHRTLSKGLLAGLALVGAAGCSVSGQNIDQVPISTRDNTEISQAFTFDKRVACEVRRVKVMSKDTRRSFLYAEINRRYDIPEFTSTYLVECKQKSVYLVELSADLPEHPVIFLCLNGRRAFRDGCRMWDTFSRNSISAEKLRI